MNHFISQTVSLHIMHKMSNPNKRKHQFWVTTVFHTAGEVLKLHKINL